MSNKSKAVVAALIVAGILGLVIFDLALSPGKPQAPGAMEPVERSVFLNATPAQNSPATSAETPVALSGDPGAPDPTPTVKDPQPPPATAEPTTKEYTVKKGDSLWKIAQAECGDSSEWKRILEANPGLKADSLPEGKKILIPCKRQVVKGVKVTPGNENARTYTVLPGDQLSTISQKFYKTVKYAKKILEANKELIKTPDRLKAGMQIVIPQVQEPSMEAQAPAPAAPQDKAKTESSRKRVYTVKPNDSLWKIAAEIDSKHVLQVMDKIVHANPDKLRSKEDMLRVDWELMIPD